jgi:acetate kinase
MNVLVINAGSSSLKYQLFDTETNAVKAKGICERIGIDGRIVHKVPGKEDYTADLAMPNHSEATRILVDTLTDSKLGCIASMKEIEAVGHRVVHGGPYFSESVVVTDDVLAKLELCRDLAPLHTGPSLMGIHGCIDAMPGIPQVLVFDTAFHQTMPEEAYTYAIERTIAEKYHIRRYGFHGTSHRYVSAEMAKLLDKPLSETKIVTCHLGNGSSITAVDRGVAIDTSMGFTPQEGVVMGTRSGSIDPTVVTYLMKQEGYTAEEMENILNKKSGLLGISGISNDCRNIWEASDAGNKRASLAMKMLANSIKKHVGAYVAELNGLDALVFTAGIGENDIAIREAVCDNLSYLGIEIDKEKNRNFKRGEKVNISAEGSKVQVWIIPTDEEYMIALDTERIVNE